MCPRSVDALFPDFFPVSRSPPGVGRPHAVVWSDAASPPTRRGAPRSPPQEPRRVGGGGRNSLRASLELAQ